MKLYLLIIGVMTLLISAVNVAFSVGEWYFIILSAVFSVVMLFAVDSVVAVTVKVMPDRLFGTDSKRFEVSRREIDIYIKLGVRRWKDKIWDLGAVGGFSKKKILHPDSPEYIEKFIVECNKGVLIHRLCYAVGFLVMLIVPYPITLTVTLPCALVNLVLNIMPTMALRYNTPKLKTLLKRLKNKQKIIL